MGALIGAIISFFVQALVLKLALSIMGQPSSKNRYSTAMGVALALNAAGLVLGLVPFFLGWLIYPVLWLVVIVSVYRIGFMKSLGVAFVQLFLRIGVALILFLLGFFSSFGHAFHL